VGTTYLAAAMEHVTYKTNEISAQVQPQHKKLRDRMVRPALRSESADLSKPCRRGARWLQSQEAAPVETSCD
jgi:hypothetical protein